LNYKHTKKMKPIILKKTRGGKRPGAGRPKGSGKGRTVTNHSVSMPHDVWAMIDEDRGNHSRGKFIASLFSFWLKLRP